jgi:hypothetical protein
MQDQNVRIAASFIIGLLVGVGGYWLIASQNNHVSPELTMNEEDGTSSEVVTIQGDNGVLVNNQVPGSSVLINQVLLKGPGWVAIHDDVNGQPGRILGARLFDAGSANGIVQLLRNTVNGKSYFAVIHTDDGNYKNFTPKTDKVLTGSNGEIIMTKFEATTSPVPTPEGSSEVDGSLNL